MYWEEKIDILKRKFPPTDFRVPFTDWPEILKKVEAKFIIKNNSSHHYNNWSENLKEKVFIRAISKPNIFTEIKKLDETIHYWVVIVHGNATAGKHFIYDCKRNALEMLLSFTTSDFYIADKKYNWLTLFAADKDDVAIYKSGKGKTPFDN